MGDRLVASLPWDLHPVTDIIQLMAPVYKEKYHLESEQDGLRMATEDWEKDSDLFFHKAVRHALKIGVNAQLLMSIYNALHEKAQMAIRMVVEDVMAQIRPELELTYPDIVPNVERCHVIKWTIMYCTEREALLKALYEHEPPHLLRIYENILDFSWAARFLVKHGDPKKDMRAEVAELYMRDRSKFLSQCLNMRSYVRSVARAKQVSKQWCKTCKENPTEPYMFIPLLFSK
jgi:hypothetical protein